MRTSRVIASLLGCAAVTAAFTPPSYWRNVPPPLDHYRDEYRAFKQNQKQVPMNPPGPAVPADSNSDEESGNVGYNDLTISDVLPRTRSINVFASLTRDVEDVSGRLDSTKASDNTTLLAPLNSAMQSLPRKPWEDRPGDDGPSAASHEEKAAENLKTFVTHHVVPVSPWKEGKEHTVETLGGQKLWWETRGGGSDGSDQKRVIMPGEIVVSGVVGRVGNGEIWALKDVVNYE